MTNSSKNISNTKNLTWHKGKLNHQQRCELNGHNACLIWFTGLSGSGKSTLANLLDVTLHSLQVRSYVLDGDNLRYGLNRDLNFSPDDRRENIRRVGEVGKLLLDAGLITIAAFISPYRQDREYVRNLLAPEDFIEIYLECSIDCCRKRDPKGLYKRAYAGEIKEFTGISAPYEVPENSELTIHTNKVNKSEAVAIIIEHLQKLGKF